ncbi:MAG: DUF1848 domain-containing protein [Desulfobacteraceae bacterium]|jgi:hypothetical protein|nr:DUF1848 domain-containing protein [Desulfobacteraceae bacterium]
MKFTSKIVISASRRTDIPAFYMPWFMEQIGRGFFEVVNPFNQHVAVVPVTATRVHTIVFWSKNFGPFIDRAYGRQLIKLGYHLFFNFTINSDNPDLEPNVPPLNQRLDQLEYLSSHYGPEAVNWRFDPICFYRTGPGALEDNLRDFSTIADGAAKLKISRCITSFMDHYPKIRRRLSSRPGFEFIDPSLPEKINTILDMETQLAALNIRLFTCCEKDLIQALPVTSAVTHSSCIPGDLLMEIYPGRLSLKKDTGQRVKAGCGCRVSVDIGSYSRQPCYHNCLFCYANPKGGHGAKGN